jgi:hypothetical protein
MQVDQDDICELEREQFVLGMRFYWNPSSETLSNRDNRLRSVHLPESPLLR